MNLLHKFPFKYKIITLNFVSFNLLGFAVIIYKNPSKIIFYKYSAHEVKH